LYERARFAADPLTEVEFRALMSIFAEILRGMTNLDPLLLAERDDDEGEGDSMAAADESAETVSYDSESIGRHGSDDGPPRRLSEDSVLFIPSEDSSHGGYDEEAQRKPPGAKLPSRRTEPSRVVAATPGLGLRQTRSTSSMASKSSPRSSGSVIRLAGSGSDLPYIIRVPNNRSDT
jgi:hypothetical protein